MLTKRIIPCLDIKDGRTVKGVNFVGLRDAGDPVELAAQYAREGADELVFLDITATVAGRRTFADLGADRPAIDHAGNSTDRHAGLLGHVCNIYLGCHNCL